MSEEEIESKEIASVDEVYQEWYTNTFDVKLENLTTFIETMSFNFKVPDRQHIVAAAGLAAMRATIRHLNGGLNEQEMQQTIANVFSGWMNSRGPLFVAIMYDMLDPRKENQFRELPQPVWKWLQDEAKSFLDQINDGANQHVLVERAAYLRNASKLIHHLEAIIAGRVPFGWRVGAKPTKTKKGKPTYANSPTRH